jgi:O-acetyl-ADP-ribose deacetylase (regulator of RNase III)
MLRIEHGDLFRYPEKDTLIAHGCNAMGVMGSGFAGILRKKHPLNYLAYRRAFEEDGLKLGIIVFTHYERHIANIVTQEKYGRDKSVVYCDYSAIREGLTLVAIYAACHRLTVVLPMIGGGLANGDHDRLLNIFNGVFEEQDAILFYLKE